MILSFMTIITVLQMPSESIDLCTSTWKVTWTIFLNFGFKMLTQNAPMWCTVHGTRAWVHQRK
jgi:hypothetical protein